MLRGRSTMWTAVRLLAVCVLGVSGLYALRSGVSPRQPAVRVVAVQAPANDAVPKEPVTKSEDRPQDVEDVVRKVVNVEAIRVEPIRLAALQAYDEAPASKSKRVPHYRRHVLHRHWHHRKVLARSR